MSRGFLLVFLKVFLLQYFLVLMFLTSEQVHGFFVKHPSGLVVSSSTKLDEKLFHLGITNKYLLKASAASFDDGVLKTSLPETNSSLSKDDGKTYYEEKEGFTITKYPWSESQQWALRDNLPKYIVRIPIKQKRALAERRAIDNQSPTKEQEETVLMSFALWRSLQQDVPELSGYPIDFLQARHEDAQKGDDIQSGDVNDDNGKIKMVQRTSTPGVLPFLQDYDFSPAGGICGYAYGMDGVSDGSRIETSVVRDIKESLPKGYVQTSDGYASFELGNPLRIGEGNAEKGRFSGASDVRELGLDKISDLSTNQLRSLVTTVDDDDEMLIRLGALSGFLLAGATAINMLSHHLTVNVFWV